MSGAATKHTSTDSRGFYEFTGLKNGIYTIKPSKDSYSFNPGSITTNINGAALAGKNFAATLLRSSLTVTISPRGAIDAGAKWNVDSGEWQKSGATVRGLAPGPHKIGFLPVAGWTAPQEQTINLAAHRRTSATGAYARCEGLLRVTIKPQRAINAGARWRVDSGTWKSSGATVKGLTAGSHEVSFSKVNGWREPISTSITIVGGKTAITSGTYVPQ